MITTHVICADGIQIKQLETVMKMLQKDAGRIASIRFKYNFNQVSKTIVKFAFAPSKLTPQYYLLKTKKGRKAYENFVIPKAILQFQEIFNSEIKTKSGIQMKFISFEV